MNVSAIALMALAYLAIKNTNKSNPQSNNSNLKGFLSDDTNRLIDTLGMLNDKNASKEDKTGALLAMVTNPALMSIAGDLLGGSLFSNGGGNNTENNSNKTENYSNSAQNETYNFADTSFVNNDNSNQNNTYAYQQDNTKNNNQSYNTNNEYNKTQQQSNDYSLQQTSSIDNRNEEGYPLGEYSEDARNFFRPIENVASIEATHKLYKLYDDWYSKKRK